MIENRRVIYGMDTDTDERDVANGYCRKAVNVRIGSSDGENRNSVELIKGNEIRFINLPEGVNTTIGAYEYKRDSIVYYFNHNSLGNHNIIQYNFLQERSVIVMISELLNFSKDYLITHVDIVDLDNDNQLIYFVDRLNPPRKFNIGKSIRTFNTGLVGDKYDMPITLDVIDAIKYPPLFPPVSRYFTDAQFDVNYFKNELWQFKTRYVYDDNEKSAYSPISKQTISNTSYIQTTNQFNNAIKVEVPKGGELVKRLEIVARPNELADFIVVSDKFIEEYDVDVNGNYIFDFYNDGNYLTADLRDSLKPFDRLPILAGTQSLIEGNRIVYGDIVEDYNNVEINTDLSVEYEEFEDAEENQKLNTIKGSIIIRNVNNMPSGTLGRIGLFAIGKPSFPSEAFQKCQPIRFLNGAGGDSIPYFGSVSTAVSCVAPSNSSSTELSYLQRGLYYNPIPLGGFVVYLVGTNLKAVSKQRRLLNSQDKNNIFFLSEKNTETIVHLMDKELILSDFEIKGVPDGEYIVRVASHLTTQEEFDDITRPYERTSTFTLRVGGINGGECRVKVEGGEVKQIGLTEIADITYPKIVLDFNNQTKELSTQDTVTFGYLHDNEADEYLVTNDIRAQQRVTYSRIFYKCTVSVPQGFYGNSRNYVKGQTGQLGASSQAFFFTDHNGFFFIKTDVTQFVRIQQGTVSAPINFYRANETSLVEVTSVSNVPNVGLNLLGQVGLKSALSDVKSSINSVILDTNGSPVPGLIALAEKGDFQITDNQGIFSIIVYADSFFAYEQSLSISRYAGTLYAYGGVSQIKYNVEDNILTTVLMNLGINNNPNVLIYNSQIVLTLPDFEALTTFGLGKSFLKRGTSYEFGLVYFDRANRSGAVNTNESLKLDIPFFTDKVKVGLQSEDTPLVDAFSSVPVISGYINHKAPSWATHYAWVRTKKLTFRNYIQFISKSATYKTISGAVTSSNDGYTIEINIDNIVNGYNEINKGSELVYTFSKGDRMRFIQSANGFPFTQRFDLEILNYDIGTGVVTLRNEFNLPTLTSGGGDLFEIYTPVKDLENNFFFEIGEFYGIENGFHLGNEQNQTDTEPAIVKFTSGDTYLFKRNMPIDNNSFKNEYVESNYVNDFVDRNFITADTGRPNIVNMDIKQLRRPTTIYYSQRFIPETGINGLNSFFDENFEQYDRKYGSIQRLASFDKRLECYQELKVGQILVEENVIFDQFAQGQVASSEKVLSKIIYYTGEYGIGLHPESFSYYGNRRYFVDYRRGVVCRLSNDGITLLSDIKMEEFFEDKFKEYLSQEKVPTIFTTYDVGYDELVVAFGGLTRTLFIPPVVGNINFGSIVYETKLLEGSSTIVFDAQLEKNETGYEADITIQRDIAKGNYIIEVTPILPAYERKVDVDIKPITLAFSETTKHWTSFYSFTPEYMCSVGLNIVSFQNGQLFLHDQNQNHSMFYGNPYKSELWVPFNAMPESSKILKSIVLYTTSPFDVIIETLNGQETNNTLDDFLDEDLEGLVFNGKENAYYSQVWRDINTINEDSPVLARINGDAMRDRSFLVKLETSSNRKEILYEVGLNYAVSSRNLKETSDIASKLGKLLS